MANTIVLRRTKSIIRRYFYRVQSPNGQIKSTSQLYFSRSNARRAAKKEAKLTHARFFENI